MSLVFKCYLMSLDNFSAWKNIFSTFGFSISGTGPILNADITVPSLIPTTLPKIKNVNIDERATKDTSNTFLTL